MVYLNFQVKADKNLTYIPTEEDKKRTLKETAPVINLDGTEEKLVSGIMGLECTTLLIFISLKKYTTTNVMLYPIK